MNESNIQIKLPKRVEKGMVLTADYLNAQREAIARLANRGNPTNSEAWAMVYPPLTVALKIIAGSPVTYAVSVSPGYVCERTLAAIEAQDALLFWEVDHDNTAGTKIVDVDGFPTEYPIALGEALYVQVIKDVYGSIDEVSIGVLTDDQVSLNYIPTIQTGEYFYKLAALETVDGETALVNYLAGSHIYHTSGLTADFQIMGCTPPYDPELETQVPAAQLGRLSFADGILAAVGLTVAQRPLAEVAEHVHVETCS